MVQTADFTQDEFIIGIFATILQAIVFYLIFGLGGLEKLHNLTIFLQTFQKVTILYCYKFATK